MGGSIQEKVKAMATVYDDATKSYDTYAVVENLGRSDNQKRSIQEVKLPSEVLTQQSKEYKNVITESNCADKVRASKFLLVVICMSSKPYLSVYKR